MAPAYRIDHPDFQKPRAVEARDPKTARAHVAKELKVTKLGGAREIYDLAEQGVDLVTAGKEKP